MSTEASEVGAEPSLASILSSAEPATERTEAPAAAEPPAAESAKAAPAKEDRPRGANGQFAAKEPAAPAEAKETPATAPAAAAQPEQKQERPDFVNAIIAERKKRQEAQRAAQPANAPKADFFENPQKAIEETVTEKTAPLEGRFFDMSLKAARANRDDFETAAQAFYEAGQKDARLFEAMNRSEDPGELIYALGVQLRELGDPEVNGDIIRYRKKVTAEAAKTIAERDARIKALEEENAGLKRQHTELSTVGRSLNTTTSGRQAAVEQTDEDDLKSIARFGNSKQR